MTLNSALGAGFAGANRHLHFILIDIFWKFLWIALTGVVTFIALSWLAADLGSIEFEGEAPVLSNPLVVVALFRELWNMYALTLFGVVSVCVGFSALAWVLLESYFRAGFLPQTAESFGRRAAHHFRRFLAAGLLKQVIIGVPAVILLAMAAGRDMAAPDTDLRTPMLLIGLVFGMLWFAATAIETVIRSNAVDLLGPNLGLIGGIIGTLLIFEGMLTASLLIGVVTLLAAVTDALTLLLALIVAVFAGVLWSVIHSYLLIVRFFTIGIMRHVSDL